jgi:hypothetical protein
MGGEVTVTSPSFCPNSKRKKKTKMEGKDTWDIIGHILEAMGIFFIPFIGYTLMTIIAHSKQIIILESKVNDSLDHRMKSIEKNVQNLESKIERKIDVIEANVIDCKMSLNTLITEKFETLMMRIASTPPEDRRRIYRHDS